MLVLIPGNLMLYDPLKQYRKKRFHKNWFYEWYKDPFKISMFVFLVIIGFTAGEIIGRYWT